MKKLYLLVPLLFSLHLYAQSDYELGEGLQVDDLPVYIGGYISSQYAHQDKTDRYSVDDLAIMSYGSYEKFSYMAEFEFKDLYTEIDDRNSSVVRHDQKLYAERLYIDYEIDDEYSLRVGKYNSPIGFWNLLPINVLRETTSSPVLTTIIYPKFTTGADLSYTSFNKGELKIDLILQNNNALDDNYNNYKVDKHYGLGISYEKDGYTLKFNGGYFHQSVFSNNNERSGYNYNKDLGYALISGKYEAEQFELLAEAATQRSNNNDSAAYASYLQGTYHFTGCHSTVLRVESFQDPTNHTSDSFAVVGYTFRPLYPIALKVEYQFHSLAGQDQFLASFSVMF